MSNFIQLNVISCPRQRVKDAKINKTKVNPVLPKLMIQVDRQTNKHAKRNGVMADNSIYP